MGMEMGDEMMASLGHLGGRSIRRTRGLGSWENEHGIGKMMGRTVEEKRE